MKQVLMILSVLGLGVSQASGAVEANFQPNSGGYISSAQGVVHLPKASNTVNFSNSQPVVISSDDEISQAIRNLSVQAQQKEDRLASLAERLSEKQSPIAVLDSSAAPVIAARRAAQSAHASSVGRCAMYVRKALQAAGYRFTPNPSAYQYATRGTLANAGFVKISNNLPPQVGDVVVISRSSKHPHGHIQIYDGNQWVSDFRQSSINPYSVAYSYTTWRDARYHDDASDRGIYLAMAE